VLHSGEAANPSEAPSIAINVDGEPERNGNDVVVPPLWSTPHGFLPPLMATLLTSERVDDGTHPRASLEEGPVSVPLVPHAQPLDSLNPLGTSLTHDSGTSPADSRTPGRRTPELACLAAAITATKPSTQEDTSESDANPKADFVLHMSDVSALDILYTFLKYLTQRQLQVVCTQVET
jgi:hypothetical protein